jgi:hypothetical protein
MLSSFRSQTGERAGCTCPCAANYDATATTNDDSCVYTGGPSPVGASEGIKPTINRPSMAFRKQTGGITPRPNGIQPCTLIGHPVPDGYFESFSPESNGCGRCNCVIPDLKDCPDVFGQWLGGADDNVDESTCNCNFQSAGCVMTGGLLDPTTRRPRKTKLPMMRSATGGRDIDGFLGTDKGTFK